jgi:hypothetical protein
MNPESKYINLDIKHNILQKQNYKCANNPSKPSVNLSDYSCLLWKINSGFFNEAGYEFEHINEFSLTFNNSLSNIQVLCPSCYCAKRNKFLNQNSMFTSSELAIGRQLMDID